MDESQPQSTDSGKIIKKNLRFVFRLFQDNKTFKLENVFFFVGILKVSSIDYVKFRILKLFGFHTCIIQSQRGTKTMYPLDPSINTVIRKFL